MLGPDKGAGRSRFPTPTVEPDVAARQHAVQSGLDEKQIERERQHEADPVVARGKVAHDVFCFAAA